MEGKRLGSEWFAARKRIVQLILPTRADQVSSWLCNVARQVVACPSFWLGSMNSIP